MTNTKQKRKEAKNHEETNSTSENLKTTQHPRNTQEDSEGDQLGKVELLSVIVLIDETMNYLNT